MHRLFLLPLLLCLASPARADDLAEIRGMLEPLRVPSTGEARGAKPVFTPIKHRLRAWVESRLEGFPADGDVTALERRLNADLVKADLVCGNEDEPGGRACPSYDPKDGVPSDGQGYLYRLNASYVGERKDALLIVTRLGVDMCGDDDSAYLYRSVAGRWVRFWEQEQNDYRSEIYQPRGLTGVELSEPRAGDGKRLVLAMGQFNWCSSNWQSVYYDLWLAGRRPEAAARLLAEKELSYNGVDDPILGRVTPDHALVQFHVGSLDRDTVFQRYALRNYKVEGDRAIPVGPRVLGPRDALEEWIARRWPKLHGIWFEDEQELCGKDGLEWQFSFQRQLSGGDLVYGHVRWDGLSEFTVLGVDRQKRTDCRAVRTEATQLPPPLKAAPQPPATTQ